jgi:hypothetical protein
MHIRIFAASAVVAAGLTASLAGVAAAGTPATIDSHPRGRIMVCDAGVIRPATDAERREVDTTRDGTYDRRDGRLVQRDDRRAGRIYRGGERC